MNGFFTVTDELAEFLKKKGIKTEQSEIEKIFALSEEFEENAASGGKALTKKKPKFFIEGNTREPKIMEFLQKHQVQVGSLTKKRWKGIQETMGHLTQFPFEDMTAVLDLFVTEYDVIGTEVAIPEQITEQRLQEMIEFIDQLNKLTELYEKVEDDEKEIEKVSIAELDKMGADAKDADAKKEKAKA